MHRCAQQLTQQQQQQQPRGQQQQRQQLPGQQQHQAHLRQQQTEQAQTICFLDLTRQESRPANLSFKRVKMFQVCY